MFFSLDLLSIRGGKMNTIWLLGTVKEKEAIIKKKKAELLKNDLKAICADLVSRFPVQVTFSFGWTSLDASSDFILN